MQGQKTNRYMHTHTPVVAHSECSVPVQYETMVTVFITNQGVERHCMLTKWVELAKPTLQLATMKKACSFSLLRFRSCCFFHATHAETHYYTLLRYSIQGTALETHGNPPQTCTSWFLLLHPPCQTYMYQAVPRAASKGYLVSPVSYRRRVTPLRSKLASAVTPAPQKYI